jgi:TRAP-type C4-dicarboxylate transport system permease small subunit
VASISAVALGAMMFLSVADVVGRYFFLRPVEGTAELVGILLVVASSLGLGYCQLIKGNVRISVITDHFSPRGQSIMYIFAYIICIAASVIICWQGSLMMQEFMFKQLGGVTSILAIPFWPFMLVMILGFAWVTVIFLIDLFNTFVEVFKR